MPEVMTEAKRTPIISKRGQENKLFLISVDPSLEEWGTASRALVCASAQLEAINMVLRNEEDGFENWMKITDIRLVQFLGYADSWVPPGILMRDMEFRDAD